MKYIFIIISLCISTLSFSQSRISSRENDVLYDESVQEDNFIDPDSVDYEAYTKKTSSFKALFNGKPGKAIMYGMLLPGGGQIYNKKYWKVPIALTLEAAAITTFILVRQEYNMLNEGYLLVLGGADITYRNNSTAEQFYNSRNAWRKLSEQAGVAMLVVHIIIAVEAYINRHLIDFDISEDLSLKPSVIDIGNRINSNGVSLSYRFGGDAPASQKHHKFHAVY